MALKFQKGLSVKPQQSVGKFKFVKPAQVTQPRPDIKQSDAYKNSIAQSQKYADEAKQASSFSGMATNFLKATPQSVADVLLGTPAKFIASTAEVPEIAYKGNATQREYKIPGLSPFKSYQSDFQNVANDVIDNKAGLGSAAWSLAQPVLGGLEVGGIAGGLNKGLKAFRGASSVSQGIRKAAPEVLNAFVPTTRGLKSGATEAKVRKELGDLQLQRMRASLEVKRPQPQGYQSGLKFEAKPTTIKPFTKASKIETPIQTPEEAAKSFKQSFDKIYNSGSAKVKTETALDISKREAQLASERSAYIQSKTGELKSYSSEDIASHNKKAIQAGKEFDLKNQTPIQIPKESPLIQEARKTYYHGSNENIGSLSDNPIFTTTDKELAKTYGKNIKKISLPEGKTLDLTKPQSDFLRKLVGDESYSGGEKIFNNLPIEMQNNVLAKKLSGLPRDFLNAKDEKLLEDFLLVKNPDKYLIHSRKADIINFAKKEGYDYVDHIVNEGNMGKGNYLSPRPERVVLNPKKLSQPLQEGATPTQTGEIPQLSTKGKITTPNVNYKKFIEENLGLRDKTPDTRSFNKPIQELEKKLSQPGVLAVQDLPQGTPRQGLNRFYPDVLRSGERSIENQGTTGQAMVNLMEGQRVAGDLQAGKWKALVNQFTGQLNDAQKSNLTDVLEGKANPMDATVGASSKVMRNLLNKIQGEAVGAGLNTGKLENYFPRKYNWSDMIKSGRKEQIYQHMVDTGQASTKAEAEQFFKDFVIKNSERKAGNLEHERMFDIPGYERDPEKALTMYAETAAKRITETKAFGKGDENISALINKISDEGGDYKSAQKIFDYVYKGEDKNAFTNAILGYNAFTKLSLAFFSNLTQSANTAAKGGLLNTVKGAAQALAQGYKATKGKSFDDIAMLSNALDEHITMQESGLSNKFINGAMYLFQKIENFNRRTSANTGVLFAKELAQNPESAYAVRQLKSLGLDVNEIVKGKLTQEQLLTAANKMTKTTQFKANALMMPQAWRTPLGKVLTQFKGFSFMQTKFLRDEVVKEVAKGNLAPLLRFMAIAPIASYVTQSARNWVNQSKSQSDFRQGDLYRKAVGDLPSDIVSQFQYANSKKDAWYTTPLTNVKNFASPIIGPTGGDIMQLASALEQKGTIQKNNEQWYANHPLAQSDPNLDLKRFAVQKIPFIGRNLNNTTFGYKPTEAKTAKQMLIDGLNSNNDQMVNEAIAKDPYLYNEAVIQKATGHKIVDMSKSEKDLYDKIKQMRKSGKGFYQP